MVNCKIHGEATIKKNGMCRDCWNVRRNERRALATRFVNEYKLKVGCESCGYNEYGTALQLAHIERGVKSTRDGKAYSSDWRISRIEEEFTKCRVLCANCHSVETAIEEGNNPYGRSSIT